MADDLVSPLAVHPSPVPSPSAATVGAAAAAQAQAQPQPDPDEAQEQNQPQADPEGKGLPAEIAKIPAFHALLSGAPPAVSFSSKGIDKKTEAHLLQKHKEELREAGFGFYRSLSGHVGVIFNQFYIHPEDIKAADKMGKLPLLAPDFDAVNHAVSKSGMHNPILNVKNPPTGFASPRSTVAPQGAAIAPGQAASGGPVSSPSPIPSRPMAAGAQRKLTAARVTSLAPGGPLSGPQPGAGRLLNSILKPVV
jgi:hypothetical protein